MQCFLESALVTCGASLCSLEKTQRNQGLCLHGAHKPTKRDELPLTLPLSKGRSPPNKQAQKPTELSAGVGGVGRGEQENL